MLDARRSGKAPGAPPDRDAIVRQTRRIDLISGLFTAGVLAVLDMGPALAKKGYAASDFEVALVTSGQSVGLMLSFFSSHLARSRSRVGIVFWTQLAASLCLLPVFFVRPSFALGFVALHALSYVCWSMSTPVQAVVYQANLPREIRGQVVGRVRQIQFHVTTVFALLLSVALDWNLGEDHLVALLGDCPVAAGEMMRYVLPAIAVLGLAGSSIYRTMAELPLEDDDAIPVRGLRETSREFLRVLREDHRFRRYEFFFFLFGFANIMTIPLTQIHVVDELHASYLDLAMINVILVKGTMALTMAWWGKRVDRHSPNKLRSFLNVILALDLVVLAFAPTIGWVYAGRLFRGAALGGGTLLWMLGSLYYARRPRDVPIYTGIHAVLTGIRWSLAPFAGVALAELCRDNARPIFLLAALILIGTGVGMHFEERREKAAAG